MDYTKTQDHENKIVEEIMTQCTYKENHIKIITREQMKILKAVTLRKHTSSFMTEMRLCTNSSPQSVPQHPVNRRKLI